MRMNETFEMHPTCLEYDCARPAKLEKSNTQSTAADVLRAASDPSIARISPQKFRFDHGLISKLSIRRNEQVAVFLVHPEDTCPIGKKKPLFVLSLDFPHLRRLEVFYLSNLSKATE